MDPNAPVPVTDPSAAPPAPVAPAVAPPAPVAAAPAPVAVQPPPMVAPPAPLAPSTPAKEPQPGDPAWLAPRLEAAKQAALRAAGFETDEEAKAAAAAIKAQKESQKSLETKLAERDAELRATKTREEQLLASVKEHAARMMFTLTDAQKAAVTAVAGDDPTKQYNAIVALTPTWAKEAEAASPAQAAPAQPAPAAAPPANTAPGRTAPNGTDTSPPNHRAVYDEMAKSNPFAAARYGIANAGEVYKPTT